MYNVKVFKKYMKEIKKNLKYAMFLWFNPKLFNIESFNYLSEMEDNSARSQTKYVAIKRMIINETHKKIYINSSYAFFT